MSIYKNKVVFSLYVDIPEEKLDYQPPHVDTTISKTLHTKEQFLIHSSWLIEKQKQYASLIGADYFCFTYDKAYEEYAKTMPSTITEYNIVNFYKIKLLYDLAEKYDEVLYLDLDVIPMTDQCFFKRWPGLTIMSGTAESQTRIETNNKALLRMKRSTKKHSNRSPTAKYWNTQAMLFNRDFSTSDIEVFNTGIIGSNKKSLELLDYFNSFEKNIEYMDSLVKEQNSMYPDYIQKLFGYDNETLWSYLMISKKIPYNKLSPSWHYFMDKFSYIPKGTKLVHCIKKDFDFVKNHIQSIQ